MPIYEYACKKCGETIEVIQKFSDPLLKKHSGCGGALTKLISASGFQFKGTGWYVTDYARKGQGASSEGAGKSAASDSKDSKESKDSKSSSKDSASTSSDTSTKSTTPSKGAAKGSDA
jgi:putative FmdB family regulatory protein